MRSLARPRRRAIGPLGVIEFAASEGSPAVVCLHGYGADAADLAPLAAELDLSGPTRWIFPEAPVSLGPFMSGRAWFPIDEAELMSAQTRGETIDLSGIRPPGFDDALAAVSGMLAALEVPWDKLILGGFSQGAMVALETVLRAPQNPLGVFILSGTLVDESALRRLAPARKGLTFFQSHGTHDALLGIEQARRLNATLKEAGLRDELLTFPGGHELPPEAIRGLERYLNAAAGKNPKEPSIH